MAFSGASKSDYSFIPSTVRSDSIWLYNERLTLLGSQTYRDWIEHRWYVVPPGDFFKNPQEDRTLVELDCRRRVMRQGKKEGEIPDPASPWVAAPPRTVRQAYIDSACVRLVGTM
jgi:hypothetical protein